MRAFTQERHRLDCATLYTRNEGESARASASLARICGTLGRLHTSRTDFRLVSALTLERQISVVLTNRLNEI